MHSKTPYSDPDHLSVRGSAKKANSALPVRLLNNSSSEDASSDIPHPHPSPILVGEPPQSNPDLSTWMDKPKASCETDTLQRANTGSDDRFEGAAGVKRPVTLSNATTNSETTVRSLVSPNSTLHKSVRPSSKSSSIPAEPSMPLSPYITDIMVVGWGERPPAGFFPIRYLGETLQGPPPPFASRSPQVYVERSLAKPPLTGVTLYFPNKGEFPPPQYADCRTSSKGTGDLNAGAGHGMRALLATIRGDGIPILDLAYCSATHVPTNWTGIERSPLGFKAVLYHSRPGNGGSRTNPSATGGVTTMLCIKHDLRELAKFRETDMIRYGQSEGGLDAQQQLQQQQGSLRRKSSLIGQMIGSVTPTVIPLRKTVLVRRSTMQSTSPTTNSSKAFFPPPSPSQTPVGDPSNHDTVEREDSVEAARRGNNVGNADAPSAPSRIQRARERAMARCQMEDGLGMTSLAFDPEVAGLLVGPDLLDRVVTALTNAVRGSVLDAYLALKELHGMVISLEILPSVPMSQQMTLYDFIVVYGASIAVERGIDLLLTPACQIVIAGSKEATNGLHPVTLHHTLSIACRANEFFSRVRDDFFTQKAHALAQETYSSGSTTLKPFDRTASSDRLESIVARLSGTPHHGMPGSNGSSSASFSNIAGPASSSSDPQFHFMFPVETAEQMLSDRTFVLVQTMHSLFHDLLDRCSSVLRQDPVRLTNESRGLFHHALEKISASVVAGTFSLQTTLEAYLHLLKIFESAPSPVVDVLLTLAWLCGYSAALPLDMKTSMLQDLLLRMSRIDSDLLGLAVRRLVFPLAMHRASSAILSMMSSNGSSAESVGNEVEDSLNLLSVLWRCYRKHLKMEMSIAFHSLIIPGLRASSPPAYRSRMLEMVTAWLDSDRATLIEIFLNFENDSPVPHWTIFQDLVDSLCTLVRPQTASTVTMDNLTTSTSSLTLSAAKKLPLQQRPMARTASGSALEDEEDALVSFESRIASEAAATLVSCLRHIVNMSGTIQTSTFSRSNSLKGWEDAESKTGVDERRTEEKRTREMLNRALQISNVQGSAKSAVNFLIAAGYLENSPAAVAQFLRLHLSELGEESVGDYLGEGGKSTTEQAFMVALRDAYVKAAPRNPKDSFDKALRRFLTSGGFRLPGEGQKVERLIEAFSRRYCADHPDQDITEDGVLLLSFSLVMLNTDLHKPQIKQKSKMKKEDFIRQVSGINGGKDFPRDFLDGLYDSVAKNEIRFPRAVPTTSSSQGEQNSGRQLSGTNMLGPEAKSSGLSKEEIIQHLAATVERGLSILSTLGEEKELIYHQSLTRDATRAIFEAMATKIFQVVSSVLEEDSATGLCPFEVIAASLEMIEYSITVTLFLGLSANERRAFTSLLAKLAMLHGIAEQEDSDRLSREQLVATNAHLELDWVRKILSYDQSTEDVGGLVAKVHTTALQVAEKISTRQQEQKLRRLSMRLGFPDLMTSNAERSFIREGSVKVKSRDKMLFLFSDCLIRADILAGGKLRVEENLPLRTLRVFGQVDLDGLNVAASAAQQPYDAMFEVRSPMSSFVVQASSKREKESWVRDIAQALSICQETYSRLDVLRSPVAHPLRPITSTPLQKPLSSATSTTLQRKLFPSSMTEVATTKLSPPSPIVVTPVMASSTAAGGDFNQALQLAKHILVDDKVDTATKLLVYGFFKQATKGDCSEEETPPQDEIKRAKWHAWRAHSGMPKPEARDAFLRVVARCAATPSATTMIEQNVKDGTT